MHDAPHHYPRQNEAKNQSRDTHPGDAVPKLQLKLPELHFSGIEITCVQRGDLINQIYNFRAPRNHHLTKKEFATCKADRGLPAQSWSEDLPVRVDMRSQLGKAWRSLAGAFWS